MQKNKPSSNSFSQVPKHVKLSELLFVVALLFSLVLKCLYFQFSTSLNNRPFLSALNINMIKATVSSIIILLSIFLLIFNAKRKTALVVLDVFISILVFADMLYFRYYYNVITVPVLYQIGLVGSVGDSVISLLKHLDIFLVLDFPIIAIFSIIGKRMSKPLEIRIRPQIRLLSCAIIFIAGFFMFKSAYAKSSYTTFPYDNNYVVSNLGITYFHYYDVSRYLKDNLFTKKTLSKNEENAIRKYFNEKQPGGEKYRGLAKGKNLIIVQAEALQEFVINLKLNGKEVTPNLNKLINESVYFENFFYQIGGGNTSDAEFLCNTSLYPLRDGAVYFRFPTNKYYSLPKALKEKGYQTYAMHANQPSFWNRNVMYKSLGFDKFISSENFILDEKLGWGLSDLSFFKQSLDKIDTDNPFYAFLVTLSSHHPYNYFREYKGINVGKYEGTFIGDYIKAANYVDYAIGEFIKELKEKGLYENTLLVIYGDHSAVQKDQVENLKKIIGYKDTEFDWNMLQKVPCFIHCPGLELKGPNSTIGGEIDLFPTIANLMDLECQYAVGKDLFNAENHYVVLRNGNVVTKDYIYLSGLDTAYDHSGNLIDKSIYKKEIEALQDQLYISDLIVRKNALKKITE